MKNIQKIILHPVILITVALSLTFIVWPAARYGASLWDPFTPETIRQEIWLPPGSKVLNEPGPVKVTEVRIQAPTVIRVKDREAFLLGAGKSDRTEITFMAGKKTEKNTTSDCVDVCYVAHGRETSYLYWESTIAPTGDDLRGKVVGAKFSFTPPGLLEWQSEEHSPADRTLACWAIGLGALLASYLSFFVVRWAWFWSADMLAAARRRPAHTS
jgi:hypothetical protein